MSRRIRFRRRTSNYSPGRDSLLRRQRNDGEIPSNPPPVITLAPVRTAAVTESTTLQRVTTTEAVTSTRVVLTTSRAVATPRSSTFTSARESSTLITSSSSSPSSSLPSSPSSLPTSETTDEDLSTFLESSATAPVISPTSTVDAAADAGAGAGAGAISSNSNVQNKGLSAGAIAGIAIGGVVILAALIAFLMRRKLVAKRTRRRDDWFEKSQFSAPQAPPATIHPSSSSAMVESDASSFSGSMFPPPSTFSHSATSGQPPSQPYPTAPIYGYSTPLPPPSRQPSIDSFARPGTPPSLIPGRRGGDSATPTTQFQGQASAVPISVPTAPPTASPYYPPPIGPYPPVNSNPPRSKTVRLSFVPTREDELPLASGDVVYVLQEFDDGWCLCVDRVGRQGAVPLECLNEGTWEDRPALTRGSSLSRR